MDTIENRLQAVKSRIAAACAAAGRDPRDIVLVAVGKHFPADRIRAAHAAGQRDFGENQVQEAIAKMASLADLALVWHFIGPVQSNKTRPVAERFDWVHSVDRLRIAERLSEQRPATLAPLHVCVQVNVSGEASKSGVRPLEAAALARAVARLPRLALRGLMTIPEPTTDLALARRRFETLRDLQAQLVRDGLPLDTLSMGMSDDLEAAVAAGATMVRVGTAIFGPRPKPARAAVERP
jgi:pyridoxal phosphate enzyme (YggS family)